jgi:hypothetical protein
MVYNGLHLYTKWVINMLKKSMQQPRDKQEVIGHGQNKMSVNWVEIEPEWAYWIAK